jgi:hypothetical protein
MFDRATNKAKIAPELIDLKMMSIVAVMEILIEIRRLRLW